VTRRLVQFNHRNWVKFVPTHVGKQVSGIGLVSRIWVIHFFGRGFLAHRDSSGWCVAISVPGAQQSHIMTSTSTLVHRCLPPPPPTSVFHIILGVSTVHRPPSFPSSLLIVLSFLSQPSQAFLSCPHALSVFPHHPWAVTPFSVCSTTWFLQCRWRHPR
jgi:hypothetical protein